MDKELAVVISNDNDANILDTINAIKNAGFKNVFVQWYDKDFEIDQNTQVEICKQNNLNIIFAHLLAWTDTPIYYMTKTEAQTLSLWTE